MTETKVEVTVSTSYERNVQIWSSTADGPSHTPARIAPAGVHAQLTSSARWNVAMLFGSGLASTAFFLAALLSNSLLYAGPSFAVNNPLPPPASAQVILQPAGVAPRVSPRQHAAKRPPVRTFERSMKPPPSRFARLILGDGTHDVQPFPRPVER